MGTSGYGGYDKATLTKYTDIWEHANGQSAGFPQNITLGPGEVKAFSLNAEVQTAQGNSMGILKAGYDGTQTYGFTTGQYNNPEMQAVISNGVGQMSGGLGLFPRPTISRSQ